MLSLYIAVNEWRSKWFVSGQFADSTPQDLIKDMADIQSHVRLKAIGTVAKVTFSTIFILLRTTMDGNASYYEIPKMRKRKMI